MIVTTAQLFKHAYGNYAVGAYNINNAEQTMGLFRGCIQSQAPFIIQISKGARKYTDKLMLKRHPGRDVEDEGEPARSRPFQVEIVEGDVRLDRDDVGRRSHRPGHGIALVNDGRRRGDAQDARGGVSGRAGRPAEDERGQHKGSTQTGGSRMLWATRRSICDACG